MAGARKRSAPTATDDQGRDEPIPRRRSARHHHAAAAAASSAASPINAESPQSGAQTPSRPAASKEAQASRAGNLGSGRTAKKLDPGRGRGGSVSKKQQPLRTTVKEEKKTQEKGTESAAVSKVAQSESITKGDGDGIGTCHDVPTVNPEAPRHDGEWYWLLKAEPETRLENGVDVSFSIDDLRAKSESEGWDGIRAYAARNNLRNMNAGDKAFFYHSNCKEPGIVGTMEIVKEFSPDQSALVPGAPYHDPTATKDNNRWSLVHVEFRRKFAVPISLRELRKMGEPGGPLESMQMLKQSRLSVSRVSADEWKTLCRLADEKAASAGLAHVDA